MENTYKAGEIVFERIRPNQTLIVKHFTNNMYYCEVQENPNRKYLVYQERELTSNNRDIREE
ncbi:hypothetical protein BH10BAC4_BH10BAC4_26830 [soil metagenome]